MIPHGAAALHGTGRRTVAEILLIDDGADFSRFLRESLEHSGFCVEW